jgi:hypothetical protein
MAESSVPDGPADDRKWPCGPIHGAGDGRNRPILPRLRELEALNPGRILYRIVFADGIVDARDLTAVEDFLRAGNP